MTGKNINLMTNKTIKTMDSKPDETRSKEVVHAVTSDMTRQIHLKNVRLT